MNITWSDKNGQYLEGTDDVGRTWKAFHKGSCLIFRLDQVTDLPVTNQELIDIRTHAQKEWTDLMYFYEEQAEANYQTIYYEPN